MTPSMAVALTALVVAAGGSAFAATGAFETADGVVQGCVTKTNIVRDVVGGVDQLTGDALAPVTTGANGLVDTTKVLTPKGTVLAVAAGEKCPMGSTPQALAAPVPVVGSTSNAVELGDKKVSLASIELPAGTSIITATAKIAMSGESSVAHTIKCALTGPDGKTIPGTTSQATVPANSPNERITIPINALLSDMPAGKVAGVCKDSAPAEKQGNSGARAAQDKPSNAAVLSMLGEHSASNFGEGD